MQNKNRILKRGGFAIIAAVFLMLLITIMLLKMLSYSTETSKRTTNQYLYEQAVLLAYNATEFAMLQISQTDPSGGCYGPTVSLVYPDSCAGTGKCMYNIDIKIDYVWHTATAPTAAGCSGTITVDTPEQNGSAYVDVVVSSHSDLGLDEPIRFHRKTLQKL